MREENEIGEVVKVATAVLCADAHRLCVRVCGQIIFQDKLFSFWNEVGEVVEVATAVLCADAHRLCVRVCVRVCVCVCIHMCFYINILPLMFRYECQGEKTGASALGQIIFQVKHLCLLSKKEGPLSR